MSALTIALGALGAPLLAAALIAAVGPLRNAGKPAAYLSVAAATVTTLGALWLLVMQLGDPAGVLVDHQVSWMVAGGQSLVNVGIVIDGISTPMLVVVSLVALMVQVYSLGYMADEEPPAFGRYFGFHALFVFAMASLVIAPNVFQLFLAWELVGLASYFLIGFYYQKPSAARAALKAFWVTKFADMGLLVGLIVLFYLSGSFGWDAATVTALGATGATWVAGLFFIAVIGKSAQFPLHIWLPDAMEGPTPVSALLHAATMVAAGVYLVVRAYPIFAATEAVLTVMAYLGAFTAFFAAAIAMTQTDIKKVLAYSTCSQLGYMVAALGTGAMMGGYFHLTTHAFFKALLFLGAGSFIHGVHSNEMRDMGLWSKMKVSSVTFIIGAGALAGLPGMSGFFSKELILEELLTHDLFVPYALGLITAGMTAFYMTKVVLIAIFGRPSERAAHAHESPLTMVGPLVVLATVAAGLGFFGSSMASMAEAEYAFHFSLEGAIAVLVGLSGIAIGATIYAPSREREPAIVAVFAPIGDFIRYGAVDGSAQWLYAEILRHTANAAGWFDRYIIDGVMNFIAWLLIHSGRRLRRLQTGVVSDYVYAVVVGLILIVAVKTVVG